MKQCGRPAISHLSGGIEGGKSGMRNLSNQNSIPITGYVTTKKPKLASWRGT